MTDHAHRTRETAAQIWCEPQHRHKEMDVELAESIAIRLTQAHAAGRWEGLEEAATEARRRRLGGLENIYAANELLSMECWCRAKVKEAGYE